MGLLYDIDTVARDSGPNVLNCSYFVSRFIKIWIANSCFAYCSLERVPPNRRIFWISKSRASIHLSNWRIPAATLSSCANSVSFRVRVSKSDIHMSSRWTRDFVRCLGFRLRLRLLLRLWLWLRVNRRPRGFDDITHVSRSYLLPVVFLFYCYLEATRR